MKNSSTVVPALQAAFRDHSDRDAICVGRDVWSYAQVATAIRPILSDISGVSVREPLIGVLCNRNQNAYCGVLAVLLSGKGYVPLSTKWPEERIRKIIKACGLTTLIVEGSLRQMASRLAPDARIILIDCAAGLSNGDYTEVLCPVLPEPDDIAYVLFTSGSTGEPKGVAVSHGNLAAYVANVVTLYGYDQLDVHSQTFELSFDLSVHDMMCAFTRGGCLVRMTGAELMAPLSVVRKKGITCWFSVPSLASMIASHGGLKPGAANSLRLSLFCGEPLPSSVADLWLKAAPGSRLENLYGPTEATIAYTHFRWDGEASRCRSRMGLVPIGKPFPGQQTLILDDNGHPSAEARCGELLLGGSQVTGSYWKNTEATEASYLQHEGVRWYRTGDLVERDSDGVLHFVSRRDSQIKFRGHRIELREIENAIAKEIGSELVVVLPLPRMDHEVQGLTSVIAVPVEELALLNALRRVLPDYMLPSRIIEIDRFPTNLSGKVDRKALEAWIVDREIIA